MFPAFGDIYRSATISALLIPYTKMWMKNTRCVPGRLDRHGWSVHRLGNESPNHAQTKPPYLIFKLVRTLGSRNSNTSSISSIVIR